MTRAPRDRSRIDRRYADQLLDGHAPFGAEHDPLITLLAEATCAPTAAELGDEAAALAAFRAAVARRQEDQARVAGAGLLEARLGPSRPGGARPGPALAGAPPFVPTRRTGRPGRWVGRPPLLGTMAVVAASTALGVFGYTTAIGLDPWPSQPALRTNVPSSPDAGAGTPVSGQPATTADSPGPVAGPVASRSGVRSSRLPSGRAPSPTPDPGQPDPGSQVTIAGGSARSSDGSGYFGSGAQAPVGSLTNGDRTSVAPTVAPVPPPSPAPAAGSVAVPAAADPVPGSSSAGPASGAATAGGSGGSGSGSLTSDLGGSGSTVGSVSTGAGATGSSASGTSTGMSIALSGPTSSAGSGSGTGSDPGGSANAGGSTGSVTVSAGQPRLAEIRGMCVAWTEHRNHPSRRPPDFSALIEAAGGARNVPQFCDSVALHRR